MTKTILPISLLLNIMLIAAILYLVHSLGGWNHFIYKIKNRGLAGTYQHRSELLEKLPVTNGDIVFLGNSITEHCEWSELFQNPKIKNRGIAGDGVEGALKRLPNILAGKPKAIFLSIGVNDLFFHAPSYVLKHYETILQNGASKAPNTKIIVQSILPVNKTIKDVRIENKDIDKVNLGLKELATKYKCPYLDLNSHFKDDSGKLNSQFSVDGIHINGRGYILWRDLIHSKLKNSALSASLRETPAPGAPVN